MMLYDYLMICLFLNLYFLRNGFGVCRQCSSKKEHLAMSNTPKVLDPAFQGVGQRMYPLSNG